MTVWDTPRGRLERIGDWDLGITKGHGAYATHRKTGQILACKILPALYAPGADVTPDKTLDAIEAYKEIVLLKAFAGAGIPGIVQLEGMMEEEGWTYVFMKCYDGELGENSDLVQGPAIVPFFRALLRTVEAIHLLGVSHEDIKRGNILLLKENGRVLPILADFGFAHFLPDGGYAKSLGGTVDYSSPEKVANEPYDPCASEVWSLGIILLKLLRYPHPYIRERCTSEDLKQNILHGQPQWRFRKEDLRDGGFAEVVQGMLDRDPGRRWTIEDVLSHPSMYDPNERPSRAVRISSRSRFGWDSQKPVSDSVLVDTCFLAQLNNEFSIPGNPRAMEPAIYDRYQHWQQRWATMLTKYERQREIKDWVDMFPPTVNERRAQSAPARSRRKGGMREIHLTPVAIPPKLPRQIPVHTPPYSRKAQTPVRNVRGNEENETPRTPKMIAVGRGVGAAVGVAVPRVVGRSGFGNKRGREVRAPMTTPGPSTSQMHTPSQPAPHKGTRPLGKPVKTKPLGAKKVVPVTQGKRSTESTEQKLRDLTIKAAHLRKKEALEERV